MPVNKHALIRYRALDKCFSNFARRFYIEDLIQACNDALYQHTGNDKYSDPLNPGISRRQVLVDIDFMESDAGWGALIDRVKMGEGFITGMKTPNTPSTINQSRTKRWPNCERLCLCLVDSRGCHNLNGWNLF